MHEFWQLVVLALPFALAGGLIFYVTMTLGGRRS